MWYIKSITESYFKKNYQEIKKKRPEVTITVFLESKNILAKKNTTLDVVVGDVVGFLSDGQIAYGLVKSIKKQKYWSTTNSISTAYFDKTNKERIEYECSPSPFTGEPIKYKREVNDGDKSDKKRFVRIGFKWSNSLWFETDYNLNVNDEVFIGNDKNIGYGVVIQSYENKPDYVTWFEQLHFLRAYKYVEEENHSLDITKLDRIIEHIPKQKYSIFPNGEKYGDYIVINTDLKLEIGDLVCFEKDKNGKPFEGVVFLKDEFKASEYREMETVFGKYHVFEGQEIFAFKGNGDPSGEAVFDYIKKHPIDYKDKKGIKSFPLVEHSGDAFYERITKTGSQYRMFYFDEIKVPRSFFEGKDITINDVALAEYEKPNEIFYNRLAIATDLLLTIGDLIVMDDNRLLPTLGIVTGIGSTLSSRTTMYKPVVYAFSGNGDPTGKELIKRFIEGRQKALKELTSQKFIEKTNNIHLIDKQTGSVILPDGSEATFNVCRSLDDIKETIKENNPKIISLLTDENGDYRDSFFASEQKLDQLRKISGINASFAGNFDFLLNALVKKVNIPSKDLMEGYYSGVNLIKNFNKNHDILVFNSAPYYIPNLHTDNFDAGRVPGLTIYNRAFNVDKVVGKTDVTYNEARGYHSNDSWYQLEETNAESYAIIKLNNLPPVFNKNFFDKNIIFENNGEFFAYYVDRSNDISHLYDSILPFNNPIETHLSDKNRYGLAHGLTSDLFDGAFNKDCFSLSDEQCKTIYYYFEKAKYIKSNTTDLFIDDEPIESFCLAIDDERYYTRIFNGLPKANKHFYVDDSGIYSKDKKILYFAMPSKRSVYHVKEGVENIKSYALATLKKVNIISIPTSVKRIGELSETPSSNKETICPHLKTIFLPEHLLSQKDIVKKCFCGCNISKKKLKEIDVIEQRRG